MRTSYEDIFFYLDLTKDSLRKKDYIKALKLYIEEKNKINIKGHYGLLLFQSEGNPIFITDKKDSEIITKIINEKWQFRPKNKSFFENGLFYILSFIAESVRKKSKFNRVIVITDTPSDLQEEYQEALFNLISKIRYFPTFIDIIRIAEEGTRFFKDDVKLNIIASDTKGGIFYVQDKKEFLDIMKKLVKNKQLVSLYADQPDQIKISRDDYAFYNKLAKKLKKMDSKESLICNFCQEEICPVCADIDDIQSVCPDCGTSFHKCCITNYTINNNIGIPHIFRCPNCDTLLQIDEDLIIEAVTDDPEIISVKDYLEKGKFESSAKEINQSEQLELESTQKPQINQISKNQEEISAPPEIKRREILVGGYFGRVYKVRKVGDKIIYEKTDKRSLTPDKKEVHKLKQQRSWSPSSSQYNKNQNLAKNGKGYFKICPMCGAQTTLSNQKRCNKCGNKY